MQTPDTKEHEFLSWSIRDLAKESSGKIHPYAPAHVKAAVDEGYEEADAGKKLERIACFRARDSILANVVIRVSLAYTLFAADNEKPGPHTGRGRRRFSGPTDGDGSGSGSGYHISFKRERQAPRWARLPTGAVHSSRRVPLMLRKLTRDGKERGDPPLHSAAVELISQMGCAHHWK